MKNYFNLSKSQKEFIKNHKLTNLQTLIYINEGYEQFPYLCPANKKTIGIGYNLEANKLPKDIESQLKLLGYIKDGEVTQLPQNLAVDLLRHQIAGIYYYLRENYDWYNTAPENIKTAIADMCYNLGTNGFSKFKKTISLLEQKDYEKASIEVLNSKWATQVKSRASRISYLIKNYDLSFNQILGI